MKASKIIALILAAILAVSAAAVFTGCQKGDTKATSAPTSAATSAPKATVAVKDSAAQGSNNNEEQNQQNDAAASSQAEDDNYIDRETAIAQVKQLAGSGAQIISAEKGYAPDGLRAWIVVVSPVTASDESVTVTYYSGLQFCYPETAAEQAQGDDNYIDESLAIAQVKQLAGSGAQIISTEKGYAPDGLRAWIIVVAPVTASEEPVYDTYYCGLQFCYKADSE